MSTAIKAGVAVLALAGAAAAGAHFGADMAQGTPAEGAVNTVNGVTDSAISKGQELIDRGQAMISGEKAETPAENTPS